MLRRTSPLILLSLLNACAGLQFYDDPGQRGQLRRNDLVSFYQTKPAVLVAYGQDCSVNVTVLSIPGEQRFVRLKAGYGSNKLGITFGPGGTLASVNQETDTKIPKTITAAGGAIKNLADAKFLSELEDKPDEKTTTKACRAHADIYDLTKDGLAAKPRSFAAEATEPIVTRPRKTGAQVAAANIRKQCAAAIAGEPTGLPTNFANAYIASCRELLSK